MFGLTEGMVWPMVLFFLIGIGSVTFIDIIAGLLGAKSRRRISPGFVFLAIILSPFLEEIIFRGPVYWLGESSLAYWAVLIVWGGIIFGLIHGIVKEEDYEEINGGGVARNIIGATVLGIFLGIIVMQTHSLASAMIVHAIFNVFAFILIGITRSLERI